MDLMPEDDGERKSFELVRRGVFNGEALATVAFGLQNLSRFNPQQGSLAKMLAIYANEVAKAGEYQKLLIKAYAERKLKLPAKPRRK